MMFFSQCSLSATLYQLANKEIEMFSVIFKFSKAFLKTITIFSMAAIFSLTQTAIAAEEELAPGFNKCMEESEGVTANMRECLSNAYEYWDKKLNLNYKQALKNCPNDTCIIELKQMQRSWNKYKEGMSKMILNYGMNAGGTLASIESYDFVVRLTKEQTKLLEDLCQNN